MGKMGLLMRKDRGRKGNHGMSALRELSQGILCDYGEIEGMSPYDHPTWEQYDQEREQRMIDLLGRERWEELGRMAAEKGYTIEAMYLKEKEK